MLESNEEKKKKRQQALSILFDQAEIKSVEKKERLESICAFGWDWLARTSRQWAHESIALLDGPPAMTQKELVAVLDEIRSVAFDISRLKNLLSAEGMDFASGLNRLAGTMASSYRNALVASTEAFSQDQRSDANVSLLDGLKAYEKLGAVAPLLPSPSRSTLFCDLYDVVISFKEGDRENRAVIDREISILDLFVQSADRIEIDRIDTRVSSAKRFDDHSSVITSGVVSRLSIRIADDLLRRFERRSVVSFLQRRTRSLYFDVFFQSSGPLWSGATGKLWTDILNRAGDDPVIQRNALESLELFVIHGRRGEHDIIPDLVLRIWTAATIKPVGRMWQRRLLEMRSQLTGSDVSAESLTIPNWLNAVS
jgi:hypothetical protein